MPAPQHVDIAERISYLSASSKTNAKTGYGEAKTPVELEDGALRAGGRPNIWSRDYIGLAIQYAVVGMVYGTLPSTVYPVLQNYLNMEGTQIVSAKVLLNLPWSFKVFYGILTDCFPIFGYRRRPFMTMGWTLCAIALLIMACSKMGKPYYIDNDLRTKAVANFTAGDWATGINKDAPDTGGKFIVLMMLADVGYVGADVAADAFTVELAQREPEQYRGTTQTTIYLVRTIFVTVSNLITGFLFNGKDYGGTFDFSLSFPQVMIILTVVVVPAIPLTWIFLKEEKHPDVNVCQYMADLWELLQSRAMYQVIACKMFSGIFENVTYTASSPMKSNLGQGHADQLVDRLCAEPPLVRCCTFLHEQVGTWLELAVHARHHTNRVHLHRRLHDLPDHLGRRSFPMVLAWSANPGELAVGRRLHYRFIRGRGACW